MTVEQAIKNAIKGKGYTLDNAAEKLKMSRQTLYRHIAAAEISPDFIQSVATILGIDIDKIISDLDKNKTKQNYTKPTPDKPSDNKLSPVKETDTPYKKPQSLYNIASELWDYLTSPKRSTEDVLEADEVLKRLIERAKKEKE